MRDEDCPFEVCDLCSMDCWIENCDICHIVSSCFHPCVSIHFHIPTLTSPHYHPHAIILSQPSPSYQPLSTIPKLPSQHNRSQYSCHNAPIESLLFMQPSPYSCPHTTLPMLPSKYHSFGIITSMLPSKHPNPFYVHLLFSGNLEERNR